MKTLFFKKIRKPQTLENYNKKSEIYKFEKL